jgi:type II secretory pathway pseudopilin PulG
MRDGTGVRGGFTLLEVVVALLVLEVAVVGMVGSLVLAASTLTRAETLEMAVANAEGLLDSLSRAAGPATDSVVYDGGKIAWSIDDSGRVSVRAVDAVGEVLLDLSSFVGAW